MHCSPSSFIQNPTRAISDVCKRPEGVRQSLRVHSTEVDRSVAVNVFEKPHGTAHSHLRRHARRRISGTALSWIRIERLRTATSYLDTASRRHGGLAS
jgi:hypothetical protein